MPIHGAPVKHGRQTNEAMAAAERARFLLWATDITGKWLRFKATPERVELLLADVIGDKIASRIS